MKKHTVYTLPFRRQAEEKTNYKTRLRLLLSRKPRLVARLSSKNALAQLVETMPTGDRILATASSKQLAKLGWKANTGNISAAYLVGLMMANKAKKAKVTEAVLDIGLQTSIHGSRLYALLKGLVDGGLSIPHSDEVFPPADRIAGKHIAAHAKQLKTKEPEKYKKYFSAYLKAGLNPEELDQHFETIKKKVEAL
jgi:large subunit ribosomal protein L18